MGESYHIVLLAESSFTLRSFAGYPSVSHSGRARVGPTSSASVHIALTYSGSAPPPHWLYTPSFYTRSNQSQWLCIRLLRIRRLSICPFRIRLFRIGSPDIRLPPIRSHPIRHFRIRSLRMCDHSSLTSSPSVRSSPPPVHLRVSRAFLPISTRKATKAWTVYRLLKVTSRRHPRRVRPGLLNARMMDFQGYSGLQ
jgi:hypothetical protein